MIKGMFGGSVIGHPDPLLNEDLFLQLSKDSAYNLLL